MKMNWFILSIVSLFSLSLMSFFITFLTRKGYPVSFVLLGIGIVLSIVYFVQTFIFSPHDFKISLGIVSLIILIGILSAIGNLFLYQAANNAPNAGLALAIVGMQAIVVAILAIIFLKDKLTPLQIVGIILAISAVIAIGMGESSSSSSQDKITTSKIK